ncbi:hypothetical protein PENTCL1PPCAC_19077, partial [Pristionchus entomophagus]
SSSVQEGRAFRHLSILDADFLLRLLLYVHALLGRVDLRLGRSRLLRSPRLTAPLLPLRTLAGRRRGSEGDIKIHRLAVGLGLFEHRLHL